MGLREGECRECYEKKSARKYSSGQEESTFLITLFESTGQSPSQPHLLIKEGHVEGVVAEHSGHLLEHVDDLSMDNK